MFFFLWDVGAATNFTPIRFYNRRSYAQQPLHRAALMRACSYTEFCAQRSFYTQTPLHRGFRAKKLLHTEAFTKMILLRFYTQTLSQTEAFTQRNLFAQNSFYTKKFSCSPLKKANRYFPKQRGHTEGFLRQVLRPGCSIEVVSLAFGIFPVNFHAKWLLWNVHVHFDCAGSHKTVAAR